MVAPSLQRVEALNWVSSVQVIPRIATCGYDTRKCLISLWYGLPIESLLTDSSGVLKVTHKGILAVVNGINRILWNSNASRSAPDPNAQLLEYGNLVMKNGNDSDPENFLCQSFDC